MSRPFRFQAPSAPDTSVVRPRLIDKLSERWGRRLVTVVAGPGFGKSVLLSSALEHAASATERPGVDVWLGCEPSDESAEHLTAGLAEALGLQPDSAESTLFDAVWARAPEIVCLVLDDVHEVPAGSSGATLIARLLTDLPSNGRLVLASREAVPVPTARAAASNQLARISEADLAFDTAEVVAFAARHGVDPSILASAAGWPALAELIANAGADLVFDYLWEEVLNRIGAERAGVLAAFALVGGGDDEIACAVAGRTVRVADVVASVPLVSHNGTGWSVVHPLWTPALRHVISTSTLEHALVAAARVHAKHLRYSEAFELLAEAGAWDAMLSTMRAVEIGPMVQPRGTIMERWRALAPAHVQQAPEMLLARALGLQASAPNEAPDALQRAAAAFRECGDIDGELVALAHEGVLRFWIGDIPGLFVLALRVAELADAGSASAEALNSVAKATVAHLQGDSEGVFASLAGYDEHRLGLWWDSAQWLRSVAYRRNGELARARQALDQQRPESRTNLVARIGRYRVDWLAGEVDVVRAGLASVADEHEAEGDRVLARDAILELAAKTAFLGEADATRDLLARAEGILLDQTPSLHDILRTIAETALLLAAGDEAAAADRIVDSWATAVDGPTSWYWRDRAATGLVYVLIPAARETLSGQRLSPVHQPAIMLAASLVAGREGDLQPAKAMHWPAPGIVRANLPVAWIVELSAMAAAAGNPPPMELLLRLGGDARTMLRRIAAERSEPLAGAARVLVAQIPAVATSPIRIAVLGPLQVWRDGVAVQHADVRRQRVRELLCSLIAQQQVRRQAVSLDLWPDLDDGGRNLRVTLNYLHRVLEPDRESGSVPYFVRTDGQMLALARVEQLSVDVWELEAHLEDAHRAERANDPAGALAAYRAIVPLWNGEPYADAPDATWVEPARARIRSAYATAAVRGGNLLLATRAVDEARAAGHAALAADRYMEAAHALVIRTHVADNDLDGARRALDLCARALAELGATPQRSTRALLSEAIG